MSRHALERFDSNVRRDTTILDRDLAVGDLIRTTKNLETTYIVRMFAEFESCLRRYWNRRRRTHEKKQTPAEILIGNVGASIGVPARLVHKADEVRELRNTLIHEREIDAEVIAIAEIKSRLCAYLYYRYGKW